MGSALWRACVHGGGREALTVAHGSQAGYEGDLGRSSSDRSDGGVVLTATPSAGPGPHDRDSNGSALDVADDGAFGDAEFVGARG